MKKIIFCCCLLFSCHFLMAQELNCKVIVLGDQIQGTDPKVFKTMEQSITEFINTRHWGQSEFLQKERIECVFTIILTKTIEGIEGGYTGKISMQASRPIYGTTYTSSLVNYVDNDFAIKYTQYQAIEFNDNRIVGSDALSSNLSAIIAFYCYVIIGLDFDSFSLKGGTEYFDRAMNISNNAPENIAISGWKGTEKQKNRFWLIDQIENNRFVNMRDVFYKYHRLGLDMMTTDAELARSTMNKLFPILQQVNIENPSSMWMQFFFNAKSEEIQNYLAKCSPAEKQSLIPIISQMDVTNAGKYAELMK